MVKFKQSYGLRTYYNLKNGDVDMRKQTMTFLNYAGGSGGNGKSTAGGLDFISMSSRL